MHPPPILPTNAAISIIPSRTTLHNFLRGLLALLLFLPAITTLACLFSILLLALFFAGLELISLAFVD
jgi:hypothetical protein